MYDNHRPYNIYIDDDNLILPSRKKNYILFRAENLAGTSTLYLNLPTCGQEDLLGLYTCTSGIFISHFCKIYKLFCAFELVNYL